MFGPEQQRLVEQACAFRYPDALLALAPALETLVASPGFSAAFPSGRVAEGSDILAAWAGDLPEELVPFLCDVQAGWMDYYCFHRNGEIRQPAVLVFAHDAVVRDWASFEEFLAWIRQQCATMDA
jgi:hypothetical protein